MHIHTEWNPPTLTQNKKKKKKNNFVSELSSPKFEIEMKIDLDLNEKYWSK